MNVTTPIDFASDVFIINVMEEIAVISNQTTDLIITDENAEFWSDNLFAIKQGIKNVDTKRKGYTDPLNGTIKGLILDARTVTDPMNATKKIIDKAMLVYVVEKRRKEEEHLRFLQQKELERLEAEKKELMEQAVDNDSDYALDEADKVEEQIESVQNMDTEESGRVQSQRVTSSLSKKWVFTLEDFDKVPDEYKMLNEVKVRKMIAGKHGTHEIPGLKIYEEDVLTSRRR